MKIKQLEKLAKRIAALEKEYQRTKNKDVQSKIEDIISGLNIVDLVILDELILKYLE